MRADLYIYGTLLAAGLGAAYWASLPVPEASEDAVSVMSVDPNTVTEVQLKTADVEVVAVKRSEDQRFLVTHTKTEIPPVNPHVPKDDKAPPAAPKITTERFLANPKIDDLLKSFSPLLAVRVLDSVDDKQMADYGLKGAKYTFTIKSAGNKDLVLRIGKRSYGSRNRFAQEPGSKAKVLLIEDINIENLERAPVRLYERRIVNLEPEEVAKVEISVEGRNKRIDHSKRDQAGELIWADEGDASAKAKPAYDNFMDRIFKLRLTEYANQPDEQGLRDLKPFLTIVLEKDGKAVDRMIFKKTPGDKPVYWVTSDFLKMHAKLQSGRVESIEKDIEAILGEAKKS